MNPMGRARISRAKAEGISVLLDEIRLAVEWNRPSILMAVQKNSRAGGKAEMELEKEIRAMSYRVVRVDLCEQHSNFPSLLTRLSAFGGQVCFFRHLDCEGRSRGDVYLSLNLHREAFVEHNIRAVFWLTPQESADLMRIAPDFWAFRHRVIEFAPERGSVKN